nr:U22_MYRTX_Ta1a [Tetramorium africanum]
MQLPYLLLGFAIIFVMAIMYSPAVEAKALAAADPDADADAHVGLCHFKICNMGKK